MTYTQLIIVKNAKTGKINLIRPAKTIEELEHEIEHNIKHCYGLVQHE